MNQQLDLARTLARIAKEHDLAEIDYKHAGTRIRLVLEAAAPQMVQAAAPFVPSPTAAPEASPPSPMAGGEEVKSPLPGVFYRAPRPGATPFVEEGQEAAAGQTLCIVEAMKLMNEIAAERTCRILKILVENETVVEAGQPLFVVEAL